MDLKSNVWILLSVLIILSVSSISSQSTLMGGYLDNKNQSNSDDETDSSQLEAQFRGGDIDLPDTDNTEEYEDMPDPSSLVLPGYNLPDNLFNNGKPFYVEKDPVTGAIDFSSKTTSNDNSYDYEDKPYDIYDKKNIDRKDGSIDGHKQSDANQLTPNFHDYLNLPVKYTSSKYSYPLISSSYANTKIQGVNKNKLYNHKEYKPTTYKPPTYFSHTKAQNSQLPYYETKSPVLKTTTAAPTTTTTVKTTMKTTVATSAKPTGFLSELFEVFNMNNYPDKINDEYETTTTFKPSFVNMPSNKDQKNETFTSSSVSTVSEKDRIKISNYYNVPVSPNSHAPQFLPPKTEAEEDMYDYDYETTATESNYGYADKSTVYRPTETYLNTYNKPIINNKYALSDNNETSMTQNEFIPMPYNTQNIFNETKKQSIDNRYDTDVVTDTKNINEDNIKPSTVDTTDEIKYSINNTNVRDDINNIYNTSNTENFKPSENKNTKYSDVIYSQSYTETPTTSMATSLPLGINHPKKPNPIIAFTQNLKEKLNNEKVELEHSTKQALTSNNFNAPQQKIPETLQTLQKPSNNFYYSRPQNYDNPGSILIPSKTNIRIPPNQNTASFVVGHQQSIDGGRVVVTSSKENPYGIASPFRPVYSQDNGSGTSSVQGASISFGHTASVGSSHNTILIPKHEKESGNVQKVHMRPIHGSEASVGIGIPPGQIESVPGQVVDAELDIPNEKIEKPEGPLTKIVFPNEKHDNPVNFIKPQKPNSYNNFNQAQKEILTLNSQPMFHQLPSDLTPPASDEVVKPPRNSQRPPWDPRPGHFFNGRPEYSRPPRPADQYKRISEGSLPNILPQFRPNAKVSHGHHSDNVGTVPYGPYMRQPLLERPSNRRISLAEQLQPPPPPRNIIAEHLHSEPEQESMQSTVEPNRRIMNEGYARPHLPQQDQIRSEPLKSSQDNFGFLRTPPHIPKRQIANRRNGDKDAPEVATLQMLQSKQVIEETNINNPSLGITLNTEDKSDNPLYVVYPVNKNPLKFNTDTKETVIIGSRGEKPLPPSKISEPSALDRLYKHNPLLKPTDRNDAPLLKPQTRPNNFPLKSDFPYPLEKPDSTYFNSEMTSSSDSLDFKNGNGIEATSELYGKREPVFNLNNQWSSYNKNNEEPIVNVGKNVFHDPELISATLKAVTQKPIAIAYTPTEPPIENTEKFSVPNYASPVIPEIRPDNIDTPYKQSNNDNEFTIGAVMHTHPQVGGNFGKIMNHKTDLDTDVDTTHVATQLEFQAPFQASVSVDSPAEGWSVIRSEKPQIELSDRKDSDPKEESEEKVNKNDPTSSKKFDIENFKPQLFGGFKPIYKVPEDGVKTELNDRQE